MYPPWLCMKRKFIMMPVLIPGPKQPGNDIDVYLRPLVEELLLLWGDEGVQMWDEYKQENFNLRALLFVTINDCLLLVTCQDIRTMGYKACTHCLDDTDNIWLTYCKKVVYMGHRRFLPIGMRYERRASISKAKRTTKQNRCTVVVKTSSTW